MSIVKLKKITLYGRIAQRDEVLERLQSLGCLHLIDLTGKSIPRNLEQGERQVVLQAIQYLKSSPAKHPQPHAGYAPGDDCLTVTQIVHRNQQRRDELRDEQDQLIRTLETLKPWGEFRLPSEQETAGLLFWFYSVPPRQLSIFRESNLAWQLINQDRRFAYVVVLSPVEPTLGLPRTVLDPRPLSELQQRAKAIDEELASLDEQRYSLTRWLNLLSNDLDLADDEITRKEAMQRLLHDEQLFVLQGWTPERALPSLKKLADSQGLAWTASPPSPDENPPTLMENPAAVAGAERAVSFYITPNYRAWDPTWVMYFSFAVFFAMIMSDAAYGALMGLALMFAWKPLGKTDQGRKMRNLFLGLVVATIAWGVAIGSYFGATPKSLEFLQLKVEGKPLANHQDAMMMLSLAIGVLHLSLANLISAWQNRGSLTALCPLGWVLGLLGGFMVGLFSAPTNKASIWLGQALAQSPEMYQPHLKQIGMVGLISGLVMVFLFSSNRPLLTLSPTQWLLRMFEGFLGLTKISAAFGDTLSYLRLFALGLASAQLAVTFNNLALGMMQGPGLGFLLAMVILVVGHGINLGLGIMGGVVHGLRLNCIEFFNWSLTDEGYPFRPFNKKVG